MKTLELKEAAEFLHLHPITLLRKAQRGEIPGAKPGKRWVFIDVDLAEYIRANYRRQASGDSANQETSCLSTDNRRHPIGGSTFPPTDAEYAAALGLPTSDARRNTTTA